MDYRYGFSPTVTVKVYGPVLSITTLQVDFPRAQLRALKILRDSAQFENNSAQQNIFIVIISSLSLSFISSILYCQIVKVIIINKIIINIINIMISINLFIYLKRMEVKWIENNFL